MAKSKIYVVWKGKIPGIYTTWDECKKQINKFPGALYKAFEDLTLAKKAFKEKPHLYLEHNKTTILENNKINLPIQNSISVDAACKGNPGVLEYRGVKTDTKEEIFHLGPLPEGTVNLGEFLALVHGLAYLKMRQSNIPIYSDSKTALKWVKDKKVNTKLVKKNSNIKLFKLIDRAVEWLKNNDYKNKILKWETTSWGEIPADFGRK